MDRVSRAALRPKPLWLKILIGLHRCCGDRNSATCWPRRSGERRLQSKRPKRSLAKPKQVFNAASLLFLPIPFCSWWQRLVARPTIASLSLLPRFTSPTGYSGSTDSGGISKGCHFVGEIRPGLTLARAVCRPPVSVLDHTCDIKHTWTGWVRTFICFAPSLLLPAPCRYSCRLCPIKMLLRPQAKKLPEPTD